MKKTLKTILSLVITMTMICTLLAVSAAASENAITLNGDTSLNMASFVPSKLYQQINGLNAADHASGTEPTFSEGKLTTTKNYQYLEFDVNVTKAGLYTMYVSAQGKDESERVFMYVDGKLCTYYGAKTYNTTAYFGVTLSNTSDPKVYVGSANLALGKRTVRITSQTAAEITFSAIDFEYNTYLTNNAESASSNAASQIFNLYQKEANGGYTLGQLNVSKLQENDYLDVKFNAPKNGKYDVSFIGMADSKSRSVTAAISIDNNVVQDAFKIVGNEDAPKYTLTTFDIAKGVDLTAGEHTLKFVVKKFTNESAFIPVSTVKLTYIPKDMPEVIGEAKLFDKAKAQTFYPKDISGITFEGEPLRTGYAEKENNVHSGTAASPSPVENTYVDADGNYTFLAKQFSDGTGGTISIPVKVNTEGNYDVTVNYHITDNPANTYTDYKFYWIIKANDTFLANTDLHGKNTTSLSETQTVNAGSADFTKGINNISFSLKDSGKYSRPIVIESITLTPNTDMSFVLNPGNADITSNNVERTEEGRYEAATAWYVRANFTPVAEPTDGVATDVTFTLDAPCSGDYEVVFTYAGLESAKTGGKWNVSFNGGKAVLVDFGKAYRSEEIQTINATLTEGTNTMTLTYAGTDSATSAFKDDCGFFLTKPVTFTLTSEAPELSDVLVTEMPSAGTYNAVATVVNDTSDIKKVTLIAAVYDEIEGVKYLKNAKIVTETILVGKTKEIIAPVAVGDDITDGSIRIFVWQEGNMLPLTEVKEIK